MFRINPSPFGGERLGVSVTKNLLCGQELGIMALKSRQKLSEA
jgi:hypothetical protein